MSSSGKEMWLIQAHGSSEGTQTFINPIIGSIEEKQVAEMKGKLCLASFEDWLFLVDDESDEYFLLNLNSMTKMYPPPNEELYESLGTCTLSSSLTFPDCIIVFCGRQDNFLVLCHPSDKKWTKLPIELEARWVFSMLVHNGQLYVISGFDFAIMDISSLFNGNVQMTKLDCPGFYLGCQLNKHIVESCGDLYLVRTILAGQGPPILYFDIHQFDPSREDKWSIVESIGDRTFFLNRCSDMLVCAKDAGVQNDCLYCALSSYDGLRIFELCVHDQTMSFKLLPTELTKDRYSFYWVPCTKFEDTTSYPEITSNEVCPLQEVNIDVADCTSRPWSDLPLELVQQMSNYLPLKDCGRLLAVCRAWRELLNPVQEAKVWLLYSPKKDGTCTFFDPFEGKCHELCVEILESDEAIRFLFSRDGWVIVSEWDNIFYLLNPITQDSYTLPTLFYQYSMSGIAFSSAPSSPSCVVFGIAGPYRDSNPVFYCGEFYCLDTTGALGVFNPSNNTWRVLNKPAPYYSEKPLPGSEHYYLVESRDELIVVFRGHISDFVRVFKLDWSKMAWTEIDDLEDLTLSLDYRGSIARSFPGTTYINKLYLPRLHNISDGGAFYYCMKSRNHSSDFKGLKEPHNCVWLEPNLNS